MEPGLHQSLLLFPSADKSDGRGGVIIVFFPKAEQEIDIFKNSFRGDVFNTVSFFLH